MFNIKMVQHYNAIKKNFNYSVVKYNILYANLKHIKKAS